jgi:5-formyltetrahydrofolate cyclo-ligase
MIELAGQGVPIALPAIVGRNVPLEFRQWQPGDELDDSGLWNIPTPKTRKVLIPTLLCVPLLGFDEDCHRLGHGGGFYDRTLAVAEFTPTTVGIAYEFGRLATIYPQIHDVAMQAIVTERQVTFRDRVLT